jgi:GntR family transcriptional regulator
MAEAFFPFHVDASSVLPIWKQIQDRVRWLLATGRMGPGELLPSVRDAARALGVHPSTVVQAYKGLMELGILEVRRGLGTFVSEKVHPPHPSARREFEAAASVFAGKAAALGFDLDLMMQALAEAWAKVGPRARGPGTRAG